MIDYKFTMTGKLVSDGEIYRVECLCDGMSKYEKESWIKEINFDPKTVTITKEKRKK